MKHIGWLVLCVGLMFAFTNVVMAQDFGLGPELIKNGDFSLPQSDSNFGWSLWSTGVQDPSGAPIFDDGTPHGKVLEGKRTGGWGPTGWEGYRYGGIQSIVVAPGTYHLQFDGKTMLKPSGRAGINVSGIVDSIRSASPNVAVSSDNNGTLYWDYPTNVNGPYYDANGATTANVQDTEGNWTTFAIVLEVTSSTTLSIMNSNAWESSVRLDNVSLRKVLSEIEALQVKVDQIMALLDTNADGDLSDETVGGGAMTALEIEAALQTIEPVDITVTDAGDANTLDGIDSTGFATGAEFDNHRHDKGSGGRLTSTPVLPLP